MDFTTYLGDLLIAQPEYVIISKTKYPDGVSVLIFTAFEKVYYTGVAGLISLEILYGANGNLTTYYWLPGILALLASFSILCETMFVG